MFMGKIFKHSSAAAGVILATSALVPIATLTPIDAIAAEQSGSSMPSSDDLKNHLMFSIPTHWTVGGMNIIASMNQGTEAAPEVLSRFEGSLILRKDTYVKDGSVNGVTILKQVGKSGDVKEIYGTAQSKRTGSSWKSRFDFESDPTKQYGQPVGKFSGKVVLKGSDEEKQLMAVAAKKQVEAEAKKQAAEKAKAAKLAKQRAEAEKKRKAAAAAAKAEFTGSLSADAKKASNLDAKTQARVDAFREAVTGDDEHIRKVAAVKALNYDRDPKFQEVAREIIETEVDDLYVKHVLFLDGLKRSKRWLGDNLTRGMGFELTIVDLDIDSGRIKLNRNKNLFGGGSPYVEGVVSLDSVKLQDVARTRFFEAFYIKSKGQYAGHQYWMVNGKKEYPAKKGGIILSAAERPDTLTFSTESLSEGSQADEMVADVGVSDQHPQIGDERTAEKDPKKVAESLKKLGDSLKKLFHKDYL
jgi:hypothetical protein